MTLKTNARLAGSAFLLYIVTGITSLMLFNQATGGSAEFMKLKWIAQNAMLIRVTVVLTMLCFLYAVVLAVTIYALTRDEDRELALIAMCCRVSEGVIAAVSGLQTLALISVATVATASTTEANGAAAFALADLLLNQGAGTASIAATSFLIGSTIYCYLFLRARSIPVALSGLGLIASVLLLVAVPLGIVGLIKVPFALWIPMLVFELTFAFWLIIKGVKPGNRLAGEAA